MSLRSRLIGRLAQARAAGPALALPGIVWLALFFIAPLLLVVAFSVMERGVYGGVEPGLTLAHYRRFADPLYLGIVGRTVLWAALCTAVSLLVGYPIAFVIARARRWRQLLLLLVVLPFWTSVLVRMFAMIFLLRDSGLVNTLLLGLGIVDEPLTLLYTPGAVLAGLVYGFLPLMVLPIYASLEKLDDSLLEAAEMLGATPAARFRHVVLPLSMPGVVAGCLLTFIPALGSFVPSDLLGGAKHVMIGNLIQNQFTSARHWPFGSAAALVVMAVVLLAVVIYLRGRDPDPERTG